MDKDHENLDQLNSIDENLSLWSNLEASSVFNLLFQVQDVEENTSSQTTTNQEWDIPTSTLLQQQAIDLDITFGTTPVHGISNFEGVHGFRVSSPKNGENGSSTSWTFSETLNELFVKMNRDCPFQIGVKGHAVPPSAIVRVTPYYRRAADQHEYPVRCLNHLAPQHETNRDHEAIEHLIRSYMPNGIHMKDATSGKSSLCFPLQVNGCEIMTCIFRFMCRTSCPGGMNRRPFCLLFSLEDNGVVLGQQVLKVHVCACPRRDLKNEESRLQRLIARYGDQRGNTHQDFPSITNEQKDMKRDQGHRLTNIPKEPNMVQDVKRACKRVSSELKENEEPGKKPKVYTLRVKSQVIYNILRALAPIIEAAIRKQDTSTESDS